MMKLAIDSLPDDRVAAAVEELRSLRRAEWVYKATHPLDPAARKFFALYPEESPGVPAILDLEACGVLVVLPPGEGVAGRYLAFFADDPDSVPVSTGGGLLG